MMNIGKRIKEVLYEQDRSACWLADQIPCERSNVYNIFRRESIGIDLLYTISTKLNHDFFADLSEYYKEEAAKKNPEHCFRKTH